VRVLEIAAQHLDETAHQVQATLMQHQAPAPAGHTQTRRKGRRQWRRNDRREWLNGREATRVKAHSSRVKAHSCATNMRVQGSSSAGRPRLHASAVAPNMQHTPVCPRAWHTAVCACASHVCRYVCGRRYRMPVSGMLSCAPYPTPCYIPKQQRQQPHVHLHPRIRLLRFCLGASLLPRQENWPRTRMRHVSKSSVGLRHIQT